MTPYSEPQLTVRFENLGRETDRIVEYSIASRYTQSTDAFDFTLQDSDRANLIGLELEPVELLLSSGEVSGAQQILGRIDVTEIGDMGKSVICRGRDYLSDLVECHVDPTLKIEKDSTLADAFAMATAPCGITTIIPDDDVLLRNIRTGKTPGRAEKPDFAPVKLEEVTPQRGQGIYDFLNRIAARNGCTLQPWSDRETLCLSKPDYAQEPLYSIQRNEDGSGANNVLKARAVRDYSSVPTFILWNGKKTGGGNTAPLKIEKGVAETIAHMQAQEVYQNLQDAAIPNRVKPQDGAPLNGKLYRLHTFEDTGSKTQEQLERVATRAFSEHLKKALVYTVTMRGHADHFTGALYCTNTTIQVQDAIAGVNETLWIAARTFRYSRDAGAITELECWQLGAFQL